MWGKTQERDIEDNQGRGLAASPVLSHIRPPGRLSLLSSEAPVCQSPSSRCLGTSGRLGSIPAADTVVAIQAPTEAPAAHRGPSSPVRHCLCVFSIFHALFTEELRVSKRHLLEYRAGIKKTPHPRKSDAGYSTLGNKKADHRVSTGGQPLSPRPTCTGGQALRAVSSLLHELGGVLRNVQNRCH